jgi:DNA-binding GntR family transcriptional regulator
MIEPTAIKEIFEYKEPKHLAGELTLIVNRMKKAMDAPVVFMKEDMAFHSTIIYFVGNVRLMDVWSKIADESMRIAIYALYEKRRLSDVVKEHEVIVEALWSRDLPLSLEKLCKHHKSIFNAYEEKFQMDLRKEDER